VWPCQSQVCSCSPRSSPGTPALDQAHALRRRVTGAWIHSPPAPLSFMAVMRTGVHRCPRAPAQHQMDPRLDLRAGHHGAHWPSSTCSRALEGSRNWSAAPLENVLDARRVSTTVEQGSGAQIRRRWVTHRQLSGRVTPRLALSCRAESTLRADR
jgi:hypothetical protein